MSDAKEDAKQDAPVAASGPTVQVNLIFCKKDCLLETGYKWCFIIEGLCWLSAGGR